MPYMSICIYVYDTIKLTNSSTNKNDYTNNTNTIATAATATATNTDIKTNTTIHYTNHVNNIDKVHLYC